MGSEDRLNKTYRPHYHETCLTSGTQRQERSGIDPIRSRPTGTRPIAGERRAVLPEVTWLATVKAQA